MDIIEFLANPAVTGSAGLVVGGLLLKLMQILNERKKIAIEGEANVSSMLANAYELVAGENQRLRDRLFHLEERLDEERSYRYALEDRLSQVTRTFIREINILREELGKPKHTFTERDAWEGLTRPIITETEVNNG